MKYYCALGHERFQPDELLKQAAAAEVAGFDGVCCSDHLVALVGGRDGADLLRQRVGLARRGGAGDEARDLGSAVTGIVHRYNPVVVAQQIATLEILAPGRTFLGVGSSEAMNEIPAGPTGRRRTSSSRAPRRR